MWYRRWFPTQIQALQTQARIHSLSPYGNPDARHDVGVCPRCRPFKLLQPLGRPSNNLDHTLLQKTLNLDSLKQIRCIFNDLLAVGVLVCATRGPRVNTLMKRRSRNFERRAPSAQCSLCSQFAICPKPQLVFRLLGFSRLGLGQSAQASTPKMGFIVAPSPSWFSTLPPLSPKSDLRQPSPSQLSSLTERAAALLSDDAKAYSSSSSAQSASDAHFLKTVLSTGTLSDRLSALTLLVQASPLHNTAALDSLRSMAQRGRAKGGRDEGLKAIRCVVDWWVGGGGPARKLRCVHAVLQAIVHSWSLSTSKNPLQILSRSAASPPRCQGCAPSQLVL